MQEQKMTWRRVTATLLSISAGMLTVSVAAKFAAGYIARCWKQMCIRRNLSVDVIAPNYGPAMVVSTEDFDEDEPQRVLSDGYHTQTFMRLAWLEIVRKISVAVSLCGVVISFFLWLASGQEESRR